MQTDVSKDKHVKKKKGRTWTEAAKLVLERYPQTPMSHKEILKVIQADNLKEISGNAPSASLNSCLHVYSRGKDSIFYKVAGRLGVYGLMSDRPEGSSLLEMDDDQTDIAEEDAEALDGNPTGREKPMRERKKEKVMCVKLPDHAQTIPPAEGQVGESVAQQNGECPERRNSLSSGQPSTVMVNHQPQASGAPAEMQARRSVRQSQRQKRRKNSFPGISVVSLHRSEVAEQNDGQQSGVSGTSSSSISQPEKKKEEKNHQAPVLQPSLSKQPAPTLKERLTFIPFSRGKPRKRTHRKLSAAAQIEQTKEGCIDLETPDSILVNTNLRELINKQTFADLPAYYQYKLLQLLPECDRLVGSDGSSRLSSTALNNEFFAKACEEWRERLSEGEFTPENQQRLNQEEEKEQNKLDPWKTKHFEPAWGKRTPYDVPKATSPIHQARPMSPLQPTVSPLKVKPQVKRPKLVSTMLKQRSISQNVAASTANHATVPKASSIQALLNTPKANAQGSLTTGRERMLQESVSTTKRPLSVPTADTGRITQERLSPPKRSRVVTSGSQGRQSQAKTLAQIKAQTQAARVHKPPSNASRAVCVTVYPGTSVQQSSVQTSLAGALATSASPPPQGTASPTQPASPQAQGQTRTLAQIRAQTKAARALHGQTRTRTLAQIKAQTKAKVQARSPQNVPGSNGKHQPNIMGASRPKQSTRSGSSSGSDSPQMNADGINVQRSREICQKMIERSRNNSSMVSILQGKGGSPSPATHCTSPQLVTANSPNLTSNAVVSAVASSKVQPAVNQSQMSASKLLFSQASQAASVTAAPQPAVDVPVQNVTVQNVVKSGAETATVFTTTSAALEDCGQGTTMVPITLAGTGQQLILQVASGSTVNNAVTNPNVTFVTPVPAAAQPAKVALAGPNWTQVLIPQQIVLSHPPGSLGAAIPTRASSAPPPTDAQPRVIVQPAEVSRSASVGGVGCASLDIDTPITVTNSGHIPTPPERRENHSRNLSPEEINFLSKAGTATAPDLPKPPTVVGRSGVKMGEVVLPESNGHIQTLVSGSISLHPLAASVHQANAVSSVKKVDLKVSKQMEAKVTQLLKQRSETVSVIATAAPVLSLMSQSRVPSTMLVTSSGNALTTAPVRTSVQTTSGGSSCACSLKALVMCKKCGAFCHDDCIGPSKLCVTCLITT
ncbi:putative Polycomb group protein ASXL2 isoform X2 [Liolophura sinensis]|uniref:putative Polycomb group protein ASXL2 isoform X2 n=1 Tax=Liolophura sinensis TaxID=3198878 RepID=UPI003158FA03